MPLSLSEILSNKKVVVFSYAEDTITITYQPYGLTGKNYERFQRLGKRAEAPLPKGKVKRLLWRLMFVPKLRVYRMFLESVIVDWDILEDGEKLPIKSGLKRLPLPFIEKLYFQMAQEMILTGRETISEPIKKKSSDG